MTCLFLPPRLLLAGSFYNYQRPACACFAAGRDCRRRWASLHRDPDRVPGGDGRLDCVYCGRNELLRPRLKPPKSPRGHWKTSFLQSKPSLTAHCVFFLRLNVARGGSRWQIKSFRQTHLLVPKKHYNQYFKWITKTKSWPFRLKLTYFTDFSYWVGHLSAKARKRRF